MRFKIEALQEYDIEATVKLFCDIVDELHPVSLNAEQLASRRFYSVDELKKRLERAQFKNLYTIDEVRKRLKDKACVYMVGKEEEEVVGFSFGWITDGTGDIYWFGVKRGHRKKGYGARLLNRTIEEFKDRHCNEVRLFTYLQFPNILQSQKDAFKLFERCGFKKVTYIDKRYFGTSIVQMVRKIGVEEEFDKSKRIIISGEAGQGIKLMAHALASILNKLGKEVALNLIYDAGVRGGNITAELIYSNEKPESPFFKEADIAIQLSRVINPSIRAKRMIIEEAAKEIESRKDDDYYMESDRIPFERISTEHFQSPIFVNMIALGRLLSLIGIRIEKVKFREEFPARFLEENIKAVKYGYSYRDWI